MARVTCTYRRAIDQRAHADQRFAAPCSLFSRAGAPRRARWRGMGSIPNAPGIFSTCMAPSSVRRPHRLDGPGYLQPACRLTAWRERGLVRGVLALRWVSSTYLPHGARLSRRGIPSAALVAFGIVLPWNASAAPSGVAARVRALAAEFEANPTAHELAKPALGRARGALSRAEAAPADAAALLEATALEWAEVARDLIRASAAERASDSLEQEASALQTEIERWRAAVEQMTARVGRVQQDLKALDATPAKAGVPSSRPPASAPPSPAPAPAAPEKAGAASPPAGASTRGKKP